MIYSSNSMVYNAAFNVLGEVLSERVMLKSFLSKFPQLNRLLLAGDNFIMKLLKVPEGFEYLKSMDWVDN